MTGHRAYTAIRISSTRPEAPDFTPDPTAGSKFNNDIAASGFQPWLPDQPGIAARLTSRGTSPDFRRRKRRPPGISMATGAAPRADSPASDQPTGSCWRERRIGCRVELHLVEPGCLLTVPWLPAGPLALTGPGGAGSSARDRLAIVRTQRRAALAR